MSNAFKHELFFEGAKMSQLARIKSKLRNHHRKVVLHKKNAQSMNEPLCFRTQGPVKVCHRCIDVGGEGANKATPLLLHDSSPPLKKENFDTCTHQINMETTAFISNVDPIGNASIKLEADLLLSLSFSGVRRG
jgi:hypothetical protein